MGFQTAFMEYHCRRLRQPEGCAGACWTHQQAVYLCQDGLACLWYYSSFKGTESSPYAAGEGGNLLEKGEICSSAIMLHGRCLLWATARAALRAGWIFDVCHPPFARSSGTFFTAIWETYSMPCFHRAIWTVFPPQETFPRLSPRHSQFSVLQCEGCTEPETWPLLPPCGRQFDYRTWGWQGAPTAWSCIQPHHGWRPRAPIPPGTLCHWCMGSFSLGHTHHGLQS